MAKVQVISFSCVLKNKLGTVLAESVQTQVVNSLEHGGDLKELVRGLQNVKPGERRVIEVSAEKAYGFYDPDLQGEIPKENLSNGSRLTVGDTLQLFSPEKNISRIFRVVEVDSNEIYVDGNHPLAGQDLIFEVEILDARNLRPDESLDLFVNPKKWTIH